MGKDKCLHNFSGNVNVKSNKSSVKFKSNVEIFQISDTWQVRMERGSLKNENQQVSLLNELV